VVFISNSDKLAWVQ